ncbi:uncharacterized protein TRIVIDRAFT_219121 [Trichoderma virens Gv29-8]|uniref:Uncharacterized protein n=1 Tax=Hypocrea virens (strain Gv29-8 / FGSC 10586) TaxID=413071 RepID=G9MIM9_HYPVG|nr:uncharacterized protein TRIVIDRAFT_219121 [Trichoderma virens Gv29-8]EHK25346.1 hypothetical protein TRIVIDRAFT_219121 [Trichoderma virens Gv29-8]
MPRQLKSLQPRQRELPFSELLEEIPDEGHQEAFELLYSEINKFLKDGICKKAASSKKSLWTLKHPKEFLSFARMVARPGADGEWEKLLKSRPYRCALLSGVMMMVLEKHVFSDLLFGAGPEHAEVLRIEDSSMINIEGFRRTALRADTNRVYLEATGGVPPLFWKRVDKITAQIVALLSPLYVGLGEDAPSPSSYQALHNIVALAGWLNLAIRLSPKITVFEWVQPGEAYRHSFLCVGDEKTTPSDSRGDTHDARSRTRVMISTAPKITRHAHAVKGLFAGTATYEVMQPHVVTYTGLYADWDDNIAFSPQSHADSRFPSSSPIGLLSLLMNAIRLVAMLCLVGVLGLMLFSAWVSVFGTRGELMLLPIRLSFRSLKWWFGMILRYSEVHTQYSVVNTGWSWT